MAVETVQEQQSLFRAGMLNPYEDQAYLMDTILPVHFLCGETQCLLCPKKANPAQKVFLTREHLVPSFACKTYLESLGPLRDVDENHITLCRNCHDDADNGVKERNGVDPKDGKMKVFQKKGVIGLVAYLRDYPRTPHEQFRERQYQQWEVLFSDLETQLPVEFNVCDEEICELKEQDPLGRTTPEQEVEIAEIHTRRNEFERACGIVDISLRQWRRGDFFNQPKKPNT